MYTYSIVAEAIGLFLIGILTFPSCITILQTPHRRKGSATWGDTKDGNVNTKSLESFSNRTPKIWLCLCLVSGLLIFILRILQLGSSEYTLEQAITNGFGWLLLMAQVFAICYTKDSVTSYNHGTHVAFSSIAFLCMVVSQDGQLLADPWALSSIFSIIQIALLVAISVASTSLPLRPEVFHDGNHVLPEYSASFLDRFTFSFLKNLLALAKEKNDLDMADLPTMTAESRARDSLDAWKMKAGTGPLWVKIWNVYKWLIGLQILLGLLQSILVLGPQLSIFNILRSIETKGSRRELIMWVLSYGISTALNSWVDVVQDMVSWVRITAPMRAQLAALIFEKVMHQKDIKENTAAGKDEAPADDIDVEKTTQRILNYLGVDRQRVTDCTKITFRFVAAPLRIMIAIGFLINIISWQGVFLGFSFMLITSPLTYHYCRKYSLNEFELMNARDKKAAILHEALQGARQIKFSAQEDRWEKTIMSQREIELGNLTKTFRYRSILIGCWVLNPIMMTAISLGVHAYIHQELTAAQAFTAIGVFLNLDHTLASIPELISAASNFVVSLRRLESFFDEPELINILSRPSETVIGESSKPVICLNNATISWPSEEVTYDDITDNRFILRDVNISFPLNQLTVICGRTGSGKSLLLHSMLGETELLDGKITVPRAPKERYDSRATRDNWIIPSSIAYVAQIPWIENGTVKDNILFGLPMDRRRYEQVIEACAMTKDLELLMDGDETEIGMGGINMSGGQRWRLTLARALYSRAGIILLDDIFSAVDVHVGQFILKNALVGKLSRGRTCILATHHLTLCKNYVKSIVELEDGTAKQFSSIEELEQYLGGACERLEEDDLISPVITEDKVINAIGMDAVAANPLMETKKPRKFVKDEARAKGRIGSSIYRELLDAWGGLRAGALLLAIYISYTFFHLGRSYWLRIWTSGGGQESLDASTSSRIELRQLWFAKDATSGSSVGYYLGIYFALSMTVSINRLCCYLYAYRLSMRGARKLFRGMLFKVLRAPARWIDTVPIGRVMNRFTADFSIADYDIVDTVTWGTDDFFRLIGVIAAGVFLSPYIILISLAIGIWSSWLALYVITASRAVKRLDSITRSDVFEHLRLVLVGIPTIRAFDKTDVFLDRAFRKIDVWSSTAWHAASTHWWLIFRVGMLGAAYCTIIAAIVGATVTDAGLAGFVLAVSNEFTVAMFWTLFHLANLELRMNSAERIMEYVKMPTETLDGKEPPASWPTSGRIDVKNLVVAYDDDLPSVLKGLDFSIASRERVGIVGRTGSGKSTLTLALFRFIEAREGSITIDGQDISQLKLQSLRRNLTIIPQDPVLFSGTIRSNLDIDNEYDDTVLFDALRRVHLIPESGTTTPSTISSTTLTSNSKAQNLFLSLSSSVSEGGLNLSQGQRQLLCLARAIIRRPKILVLDEATSSVDVATDALIQKSIREEFTDCTLLVIAHRLSTIGDFDKVMVMADGKAEEFGTPRDLIEQKGRFWGMIMESGEMEKLVGMSKA